MKVLITITSCNRLDEIKKFIIPYILFCNNKESFHFLLSLDGNNTEYIDFCNNFHIPLIYSEEREGVGIAKNRVLKKFSDYDFYYFIDDDIELLDDTIFEENINFAVQQKVPHLSGTVLDNEIKNTIWKKTFVKKGFKAGGYFNFFEAKALFKVGGWHPHFSKYKRYGHSEHSYRFYNNKLQEYPFISLESTEKKFIIHNPPHVTNDATQANFNHFHPDELELIENKLLYFPITTISKYYFNGYNTKFNPIIEKLAATKKKYPLLNRKERKKAFSEFYFAQFERNTNTMKKMIFFIKSFIFNPLNYPLKHYIKTKFFV